MTEREAWLLVRREMALRRRQGVEVWVCNCVKHLYREGALTEARATRMMRKIHAEGIRLGISVDVPLRYPLYAFIGSFWEQDADGLRQRWAMVRRFLKAATR